MPSSKSKILKWDRISVKMLLSYLSILILPFIAIIGIYTSSINTIVQTQKEKSLYSIEQSSKILDNRFQELKHTSKYIGTERYTRAILTMAQYEPEVSPVLEIHKLINTLPNYSLTNQMIEETYIFFRDVPYTVRGKSAYLSSEEAYYSAVKFSGVTYEKLNEIMESSCIGRLAYYEDNGKSSILMLDTFPTNAAPQGVVVLEIDKNTINEVLSSNYVGSLGGVYVNDEQGNLITCVGENAPSFDNVKSSIRDGSSEVTVNGEKYIVSSVVSWDKWRFTSFVAKKDLLKEIDYIRLPIIALAGVSVLIGVVICIVLWKRRSSFYKKVSVYAKDSGLVPAKAKSEYDFIEGTVQSFVGAVEDLNVILAQQKELLSSSVIRSVLYGEFSSMTSLQEELETSQLSLEADYYQVVLSLTRVSTTDDALATRIKLKQELSALLGNDFVICDIDNNRFAMILLNSEEKSPQELQRLFMPLMRPVFEEKNIVPSFAISDSCDCVQELNECFKQTLDIMEYMQIHEMAGCLTTKDLARGDDELYFPMEEEVRFILLIQKGTANELEDFLTSLYIENFQNRNLPLHRIKQLCDALKRSVWRAVVRSGVDEGKFYPLKQRLEGSSSIRAILDCAIIANRNIEEENSLNVEQKKLQAKTELEGKIKANYSNSSFSLLQVAEELGVSENVLYRMFKEQFGATFSEYLEQFRIGQACKLLKEKVPIKDVSEKVGYSSDHVFRRAFKRSMGVSPSKYYMD